MTLADAFVHLFTLKAFTVMVAGVALGVSVGGDEQPQFGPMPTALGEGKGIGREMTDPRRHLADRHESGFSPRHSDHFER